MIDQDGAFCGVLSLASLAKDVEGCQDILIFGRDSDWLPVVALTCHDISKSRVHSVTDICSLLSRIRGVDHHCSNC